MTYFSKFRTATASLSIVALTSTTAFAGGLADPIIEGELDDNIGAVQESSASSVPGWVLPVVAVVAIGALIASANDDDDSTSAGPAAGGGVEPGPAADTPTDETPVVAVPTTDTVVDTADAGPDTVVTTAGEPTF